MHSSVHNSQDMYQYLDTAKQVSINRRHGVQTIPLSHKKKKGSLPFGTTQMDLELTALSARKQTRERQIPYDIIFYVEFKNKTSE